MAKHATLTTTDEMQILADVYESDGKKYAILLHMMPATKESWKDFATALKDVGYTSIAIDERGHGESTQGGSLLYETMPDLEQQNKMHDVAAAFRYLKDEYGADEKDVVVIGASIGANLAIRFLSEHADVPCAIALSPGIDYRGVTTDDAVKDLSDGQRLIVVASEEDETSYKTITKLKQLNPEQVKQIEKTGIGHGTTMIERDKELKETLIQLLP